MIGLLMALSALAIGIDPGRAPVLLLLSLASAAPALARAWRGATARPCGPP